ncbi:hypothetical protein CANINC_003912 [Pichia inconspicua]|uniref:Cyclin N-terminal domain-containing protein n=1 Tax=Pichia inconspicua TaxID=52247 RepID=A0A4T0WXF6_9ASCO|nr:hypothetical protein CANINC_003912 [[Candida] inconspicua]
MFAHNHYNMNNMNNMNNINNINNNINHNSNYYPAIPITLHHQQQLLNINNQLNIQNLNIHPLHQQQNYYNLSLPQLHQLQQVPQVPQVPQVSQNYNIGLNNNPNYMVNNQPYYNQIQQQQQQQAPPPPSQPNGGVSEVLDYDIDQMLKFISWLTFGLLKKCSTPSQIFQNNLHSVLSATRLPKSTLLLAINYLSIKMDTQIEPYIVENENDIFKIIVILLILSNKFNDDKTFKNKSWSDATNLPLAEINQLERNWLKDCDYKLFITNDYEIVENCWNTWCIKNIHSFDSFQLSTPQILDDDFQYITPISSVPSTPIMNSCQFAPLLQNQYFENTNNSTYQNQHQPQFQPISPINDNFYSNDYTINPSFYNNFDYYNNIYPPQTNSNLITNPNTSTNTSTRLNPNFMYNYCTAVC